MAAVSAVSTSPAATPGNGPRSSRTVPIGSTSMLRPIPVGARVRGNSGSGTCPAAATQTVFSNHPGPDQRDPVLLLEQPGSPGGRDHEQVRARATRFRASSGNGCHSRSACPPGARRFRRGPAWTPGRPPWTRSRRASRTGGSCGTPRPAARQRRSRPPCCRPGRPGRARIPPRPGLPPCRGRHRPAPRRTGRPAAPPRPADPCRTGPGWPPGTRPGRRRPVRHPRGARGPGSGSPPDPG